MEITSLNAPSLNNNHAYLSSKQLSDSGKFVNQKPTENFGLSRILGLLKRAMLEPKVNTVPKTTIPVKPLSAESIAALPTDLTSIIRLGHSTTLIKIENQLWLIDPVFSDRASPFSFMGPKRFHAPPIALDELPNLDGVIISHNHYDHMDKNTLKTLHKKCLSL